MDNFDEHAFLTRVRKVNDQVELEFRQKLDLGKEVDSFSTGFGSWMSDFQEGNWNQSSSSIGWMKIANDRREMLIKRFGDQIPKIKKFLDSNVEMYELKEPIPLEIKSGEYKGQNMVLSVRETTTLSYYDLMNPASALKRAGEKGNFLLDEEEFLIKRNVHPVPEEVQEHRLIEYKSTTDDPTEAKVKVSSKVSANEQQFGEVVEHYNNVYDNNGEELVVEHQEAPAEFVDNEFDENKQEEALPF